MKYQLIEFPHNSDLPESVRSAIPDDAIQSVFRGLLNAQLREGKTEMHAYIKAYRALEEQGYTCNESGIWEVKKDSPGIGDVHVDAPLGSKKPKDEEVEPQYDPQLDLVLTKIDKMISGQSDIGLNTKGKLLANRLGRRLAEKGGLDVLYSSDLPRAVETAKAIEKYATELKLAEPTDELRPWRMGGLEGSKSSGTKDIVVSYIKNPDLVPPGDGRDGQPGESFNSAKNRILDCLTSIKQDADEHPNLKIGVIMHSRTMGLLQSWVSNGSPGGYEIDAKDVISESGDADHAEVLRWGKKIKEVSLDEPEELKPGVYLIMHSLTDEDTDDGNEDLQKYLAPLEVHRDAKLAYEAGTVVLSITSTLAEQQGLSVEEVRKIDEHFASVESATESELSRNAWGGRFAAKWVRRVLAKVAKGGPGSGPQSGKSVLAKANYKPSTVAKQKIADASERKLATALGMQRTRNNSPFDLKSGGVAVEVKTLTDNRNNKITVHPESKQRKLDEAKKEGLNIHTVVADMRDRSSARYYHRQGVGSFRIGAMASVTLSELKALIQ